MAENLYENLLHTHSGYAKHYIDKNFLNVLAKEKSNVNSKIDRVEAKEEQLYRMYGCDNYQQFITTLRNLFDEKDRRAIKNFEANELSKKLERFVSQSGRLLDQEVKISIDLSKIDKLGLELRDKDNRSKKIEFLGTFALTGDKGFKHFMNKTFKGRHYVEDSEYIQAIEELLLSDAFEVRVKKGSEKNPRYMLQEKHRIENYPWGITVNDIKLAKDDASIKRDLQKAIQEIRNFIFYDLAGKGTDTLHQAMSNVWEKNFSQHWYDPAKFFAGTTTSTGFASAVQGSLGEFQTAVIFEYLSLKRIGAGKIAEIQGNIYKGSEQGKTDVEIFQALGLQVKNFTSIEKDGNTRLLRNIETNQHPDKFAQYLDGDAAYNFLNFLANFYFNTSYQEGREGRMNQLEYRLSYWLAEIMNIAILDSQVSDTVSFYLIGGKYLVPCSALLRASKELGLEHSIEITSTYKGHTDLEYARHSTKPDKKGNNKQLYQKYWTKENGYWEPTDENKQEFDNLVGNRIAIRTNFNLLQNIQEYALWEAEN